MSARYMPVDTDVQGSKMTAAKKKRNRKESDEHVPDGHMHARYLIRHVKETSQGEGA